MSKNLRLTEGRFPDYDVLSKRLTPSWNEKTREYDTPACDRFRATVLHPGEFQTVRAIADRIVPQPTNRPPIPVAALVDEKLHHRKDDGYRQPGMPRDGEAWRRGLRALDGDAQQALCARFHGLSDIGTRTKCSPAWKRAR